MLASLVVAVTASLALADEEAAARRLSNRWQAEGSACNGRQVEETSCPPQPRCNACIPQDCAFNDWSDWSFPSAFPYLGLNSCTQLCKRTRAVVTPNNDCGKTCQGVLEETKRCWEPNCTAIPFDCQFAPWGGWSVCLSSTAQSVRMRNFVQQVNLGQPCSGTLKESKSCGPPKALDCNMSTWSVWTACSKSCGIEGRRSRLRTITNHAGTSGKSCNAVLHEESNCSSFPCPGMTDCAMSDWTPWSACDNTTTTLSGGITGQRNRKRSITVQASGGGLTCEDTLEETKACSQGKAPADCVFAGWGIWTACSKACGGGQQDRTRSMLIAAESGGRCHTRSTVETQPCATQPCATAADACKIGDWLPWQACPVTCGIGNTTRQRHFVQNQVKLGKPCAPTTMSEVRECMSALPCPKIDCVFSAWNYSACSLACGTGAMTATRTLLTQPSHGGSCNATVEKKVMPCNTQPCANGCRNGTWAAWQAWMPCSQSCGSGYSTRKRHVLIQANHCGYPPLGDDIQAVSCSATLPPCSADVDCQLAAWSMWSVCSSTCSGIATRTRNITMYATGKGTPCSLSDMEEHKQCSNSNVSTCSHMFQPAPCQLNDWSHFAPCSVSCGGGTYIRQRTIVPSQHGGSACKGSLSLVEACNTQACAHTPCVDCKWGPWSAWDACSTCEGQRVRRRQLLTPGNYCGKRCGAFTNSIETTDCKGTAACPLTQFCTWGTWSTWSACPNRCGNHEISRTRSLHLVVATAHNLSKGEYVVKAPSGSALTCSANQESLSLCSNIPCSNCNPRDCYPSIWSDWSANSSKNSGLCMRTRTIQQYNNECGKLCNGTLTESKKCWSPPPRVDCVIGLWSEWSHCVGSSGQSERVREIESKYTGHGKACVGNLKESRPCNPKWRPGRNCSASIWSDWSACSATCFGGKQQRIRSIQKEAIYPGKPCIISLEETRQCNQSIPCHKSPNDCNFTDWKPWSSCIENNQRIRSRSLTGATLGGTACEGALSETQACSNSSIDCVVGMWTTWTGCDRTCGVGQKQRHRQVVTQPKRGGASCPPNLIETRPCAMPYCIPRKDCLFAAWKDWTFCTTTCGVGQKMRTRVILHNRSTTGVPCNNATMETRSCLNRPACVHKCKMGDWSLWSKCTKSCGGGMKTRTRTIARSPKAGVDIMKRVCKPSQYEVIEPCNSHQCYGSDCIDGQWNDWSDWGLCTNTCDGGYSLRHRTVGVSATSCGHPATGNSQEARKCPPNPACQHPTNCTFSLWSDWGSCSATCDGVKERIREINQSSIDGGAPCVGALKASAPCATSSMIAGCPRNLTLNKDCKVGDWSAFTLCSTSCGPGQKSRARSVVQPQVGFGKPCDDVLVATTACKITDCFDHSVDCVWNDWADWGLCNQCAGSRTRHRILKTPAYYGGKQCDKAQSTQVGKCPRSCNPDSYCVWSDWSSFTPCSHTCGNGTRNRTRNLILVPKNKASQTSAKALPLSALYEDDLDHRVQQLYRETRKVQAQHHMQLTIAFFTGCGTLMLVLLAVRSCEGTSKVQPIPACGAACHAVGSGTYRTRTLTSRAFDAEMSDMSDGIVQQVRLLPN